MAATGSCFDMKDLYKTLGVDKEASPAAIKRAHRKKTMKAHPDQSGNVEEFLAIQKAYEVLTDEERRKRYDATGATEAPSANQEMVELIQIVVTAAGKFDPDSRNLLEESRTFIRNSMKSIDASVLEGDRQASRLAKAAARITAKDGQPNVFSEALLLREDSIRKQMALLNENKAKFERMLELLQNFNYRLSEEEQFAAVMNSMMFPR